MRCPECGHTLGDAAKFCPECGTAVASTAAARATPQTPARPVAIPVEAERRQLTVMFCDLVGSTELSVELDPEDTRALVRGYQQLALRTLELLRLSVTARRPRSARA